LYRDKRASLGVQASLEKTKQRSRWGDLKRDRRGGTHLIHVDDNTPGRLKVTGRCLPGRTFSGEGLVFSIPLVLKDGAESPESLPLVEVMATR